MLKRRVWAAILAAIPMVVGLLAVPLAANADTICTVNGNGQQVCTVQAGGGGSGGSQAGGGGDSPAGFTPGPTSCSYQGQTVPCQTADGWWSQSSGCMNGYVSLAKNQAPAPSGSSANVGAWYQCTPYCAPTPPGGVQAPCFGASFWSDSPPPGINQYTPAQAAGLVVKLLKLSPIRIGMAPADKVHTDDPVGTAPYRRTWVGIPVWLWVGNPDASTWGPQSVTATYGGVTVTATATAGAVTWSSGDGQSTTCGTGTSFDEAYWANKPAVDSPTCGWRYQHIGNYTVTASTVWTVKWVGGGQNGQIAMPTTTSSTPVRVGQLESVNTPVTASMLGGN